MNFFYVETFISKSNCNSPFSVQYPQLFAHCDLMWSSSQFPLYVCLAHLFAVSLSLQFDSEI